MYIIEQPRANCVQPGDCRRGDNLQSRYPRWWDFLDCWAAKPVAGHAGPSHETPKPDRRILKATTYGRIECVCVAADLALIRLSQFSRREFQSKSINQQTDSRKKERSRRVRQVDERCVQLGRLHLTDWCPMSVLHRSSSSFLWRFVDADHRERLASFCFLLWDECLLNRDSRSGRPQARPDTERHHYISVDADVHAGKSYLSPAFPC